MKIIAQVVLGVFFGLSMFSQLTAQSAIRNGKIPKDLIIMLDLSGTVQYANYYNYRITSDGKVFYKERLNGLPSQKSFSDLLRLKGSKSPKKPKLKEKLSKKQITQIINEFKKTGFYELEDYYHGDKTLENGTCVNHAMEKGLSISINGKTKKVAFFLGCSYGENSPLKRFLILYEKIEKELSGVKKIKSAE